MREIWLDSLTGKKTLGTQTLRLYDDIKMNNRKLSCEDVNCIVPPHDMVQCTLFVECCWTVTLHRQLSSRPVE
jgi:hypothetical protein